MKKVSLFCFAMLGVIAVAGCDRNLSIEDVHTFGRTEVVYIQPPANLYIKLPPPPQPDLAHGAAGAALSSLVISLMGPYPPEQFLTDHTAEVESLRFNDQTYAMVSDVVAKTPWLAGSKITVFQKPTDMDAYTRENKADVVFYIVPEFTLDRDSNRDFDVRLQVFAQRRDPRQTMIVHNWRTQSFSYSHVLTLDKSGMTWAQRKAATYAFASMHKEQVQQTWFADDAAQLKGYFSADLQQIETGLQQFFGS